MNNFLRIRKTHRPPPQFQKTHLKPLTSTRKTSRVKITAVTKVWKNWDKKIWIVLSKRPIFLQKEVCANLDILLLSETKLDNTFPSAQFPRDGFLKPYRPDRCSNGGGILLYMRDGFPSRLKLKEFLLRLISGKRDG